MLRLANILCPQGKESQGKKNCSQPTQEELGWGQEIKMRMNLALVLLELIIRKILYIYIFKGRREEGAILSTKMTADNGQEWDIPFLATGCSMIMLLREADHCHIWYINPMTFSITNISNKTYYDFKDYMI